MWPRGVAMFASHGDPDLLEDLIERWFGTHNEVTSAETALYVH